MSEFEEHGFEDAGGEPVEGDYGQQPATPPDISEALGQIADGPPPNLPAQPQPAFEPTQPTYPEQTDPYDGFGEPGYDTQEVYDDQGGYDAGAYGQEPLSPEQQAVLEQEQRLAAIEDRENTREVEALIAEYPGLTRNPETLQQVGAYAEQLAETLGVDPGSASAIRFALGQVALEAAKAEQAQGQQQQPQQPGTQGQQPQQPHVETGAGPGAPSDDMDPQERAYHQALAGRQNVDSYGFPIQEG